MNDDETDESNAEGKEDPIVDEKPEKSAAEIAKEENDILEKELQRGEDLKARAQVGGRSTAGQETKEKTQDEKDEEAAKVFMQEDE